MMIKVILNSINSNMLVTVETKHLYEMGNPLFIELYNEHGYGYLVHQNKNPNTIRVAIPIPIEEDDLRYDFRTYINDFYPSQCHVSPKDSCKLKSMALSNRINEFCSYCTI